MSGPRRLLRQARSLRGRVALAAALLLTVALVVAALVLTGWTRRSLNQDVEADLADQVNEVRLLARQEQLTPVLDAVGIRTGQIQVIDSNHKVVASSLGVASRAHFDLLAAPTGDAVAKATVDGGQLGLRSGEHYLILARNVSTPSGELTIYGASSLRAADRAVHTLTTSFLSGIPILLLIAGILLWRAVGRALLPVDTMRREVDDIESTSLHRRVTAPASDDEVERLAHTLNGLLDRLDASAQREHRFAADASHELRSPLAAARAQLEVGLTYPDRVNWPDTANDVLIEIARLEHLAGDLLHMAKTDAGVVRRTEPVDVVGLLEEQVASRTRPTIVQFDAPSHPLVVLGERELLLRLVRNLLTNAERHASSTITIDAAADAGSVVVTISNDGPSIPADQVERIFEPFTRLDDARASDDGGAGLGLAIARGIAEAHSGTLTCSVVPVGATFVLRLPTVP